VKINGFAIPQIIIHQSHFTVFERFNLEAPLSTTSEMQRVWDGNLAEVSDHPDLN